MKWNGINKDSVNLYKGLGILLIVTHNFMHRFPSPKENEMYFNENTIYALFDVFLNEPSGILRAMFSYFGHFGVQLFVFFSAYGLALKYENKQCETLSFLKNRLIKIYPMFLISILFYISYIGILKPLLLGKGMDGVILFIASSYDAILLKLTLLYNLYPGQGFSLVGPWWFLSMIFQFYLIFPFVINMRNKYGNIILTLPLILSIIIMYLFSGEIFGISLFFTVIGHFPLLALGIFMSSKQKVNIPKSFGYIALAIFSLGNFHFNFFLISHFMAFLILILFTYDKITTMKPTSTTYKVFEYFGKISMPLFLVNGFLRFPFENYAHEYNNELITWLLFLPFLLICMLSSELLLTINRVFTQKVFIIKEA